MIKSWIYRATTSPLSTYPAAIMRIGLPALTLLILLLHLPNFSFSFGEASRWGVANFGAAGGGYPWPISDFFTRSDSDGVLGVKTAVMALVAVAFMVGWRTRISGPVFTAMWLSFSTLNPVITNTGHFHTYRVLLIFTVFTMCNRRWSLDRWLLDHADKFERLPEIVRVVLLPSLPGKFVPAWVTTTIHNGGIVLIGFQVCVIYFVSALWKLQGTTWTNGTAVYYPLRIEELTFIPPVSDLVWKITPIVYLATWIGIYAELLFPFTLPWRVSREITLVLLIGMHIGIGVLLSLPFFSLTMILADMVFVGDKRWVSIIAWLKKLAGRVRERQWRTQTAPS